MINAKLFPYTGDLLVANAARGTYGIAYDEWSDTPRSDRGRSDSELVRDLGEDEHTLPFRHPHPTLHCVAPIPIARQLSKHQVGFSWSEVSRRYKTKGITFHFVAGKWRSAPEDRRQGSGPLLDPRTQMFLDKVQQRNIDNCMRDYREALDAGCSPEQARFLLPQSMEAVWVWTGSLLGWAEMYQRRHHADTQLETRQFVEQVASVMTELYPHSWRSIV
jgi:thymidylate synthase (FAD)